MEPVRILDYDVELDALSDGWGCGGHSDRCFFLTELRLLRRERGLRLAHDFVERASGVGLHGCGNCGFNNRSRTEAELRGGIRDGRCVQQFESGLGAQNGGAEIHKDHGSVAFKKRLQHLGDVHRIRTEFFVIVSDASGNYDRKLRPHHLEHKFAKGQGKLLTVRDQNESDHVCAGFRLRLQR
jgi:hypothetical protein